MNRSYTRIETLICVSEENLEHRVNEKIIEIEQQGMHVTDVQYFPRISTTTYNIVVRWICFPTDIE